LEEAGCTGGHIASERKTCQFSLLRYVPNAVKGESVNIGLILQEIGGEFTQMYFTKNLKRARGLDPDIDEDLVLAIGHDIEDRFRDINSRPVLLSDLVDRYSNVIQLSSAHSCLTASPAKEMRLLINSLVETSEESSERIEDEVEETEGRRIGRRWLKSTMKKALWAQNLQNRIDVDFPAAGYMNYTDDFTIDFSYAYGSEWKCLQAVSLISLALETRMFPFRVAKIKSEAPKLRREEPKFIAVVEDYFNTEDKDVKMVVAAMNAEQIQISRISEMPGIARQARIELGA
jgi:hypothetical protein